MTIANHDTSLTKYTRLEALGVAAMAPGSTTAQFNDYTNKLTSLTQQLKLNASRDEALALAKAWVPIIRYGITESTAPGVYRNYIKIFSGVLINNTIVAEFANDPSNVSMLKGLVMMNAMFDENVMPTLRFGALEILKQWLGENPPLDKIETLEKLIGFLYGPIAWEVYGAGETKQYKVIHAILKEGLPFVAARPKSEQAQASQEILPGDMSL